MEERIPGVPTLFDPPMTLITFITKSSLNSCSLLNGSFMVYKNKPLL